MQYELLVLPVVRLAVHFAIQNIVDDDRAGTDDARLFCLGRFDTDGQIAELADLLGDLPQEVVAIVRQSRAADHELIFLEPRQTFRAAFWMEVRLAR